MNMVPFLTNCLLLMKEKYGSLYMKMYSCLYLGKGVHIWESDITQHCSHLAFSSACAFSSNSSEIVSSSCSRAIVRSVEGCGVSPTPRSISRRMLSREKPQGFDTGSSACWTPASHRACSKRSRSSGNSGRNTSNWEPSSSKDSISLTASALTSSERSFSLCCWKSSMLFSSSWDREC